MGLNDRDYYRRPGRSPFGTLPVWSVSTWLIALNVAVFVLDIVLRGLLFRIGSFSAVTAVWELQVWRFVTFQFLHAGVGHIFFNMLALYFFGPMIENYLGPRRFLAFYLLCGAAGAGRTWCCGGWVCSGTRWSRRLTRRWSGRRRGSSAC